MNNAHGNRKDDSVLLKLIIGVSESVQKDLIHVDLVHLEIESRIEVKLSILTNRLLFIKLLCSE